MECIPEKETVVLAIQNNSQVIVWFNIYEQPTPKLLYGLIYMSYLTSLGVPVFERQV